MMDDEGCLVVDLQSLVCHKGAATMRLKLALNLSLFLTLSVMAPAQSTPTVLAVVNGEDVTRTEVYEAAADDLGEVVLLHAFAL